MARAPPRTGCRATPRPPATPPRAALLATPPRAGGPPARPRATTPRPRPAYRRKHSVISGSDIGNDIDGGPPTIARASGVNHKLKPHRTVNFTPEQPPRDAAVDINQTHIYYNESVFSLSTKGGEVCCTWRFWWIRGNATSNEGAFFWGKGRIFPLH